MLKFIFRNGATQTSNVAPSFWTSHTPRNKKIKPTTPESKADDIRHDLGAVRVEIYRP